MCLFRKKKKTSSSPFMKDGKYDVDAIVSGMKKSVDKHRSEASKVASSVRIGDRFSKSTRIQSGDLVLHGRIYYTVVQVEADTITLKTDSGDIEKMERKDLEGLLGCYLMSKI